MIQIRKDYQKSPKLLKSKFCKKQIEAALKDPAGHSFNDYYYRDGCISALKTLYHKKCAYCEGNPLANGTFRIDHFRPKKGVKYETHRGYYWLGYEWSNLILSCEACNTAKSNQFPLEATGVRVEKPILDTTHYVILAMQYANASHFLAEKALLLNPELDEIDGLFIINKRGEWIATAPKAQKTKEICDLGRDDLNIARRKAIQDFVDDLHTIMEDYLEDKQENMLKKRIQRAFKQCLVKANNPKQVYGSTYWFMFYEFEKVVLPNIEQSYRPYVLDLFESWKRKYQIESL